MIIQSEEMMRLKGANDNGAITMTYTGKRARIGETCEGAPKKAS